MGRRAAVATLLLATVVGGCGGQDEARYPDACAEPPAPHVEWANCSLRGKDLHGSDLQGALLHDVDLAGANLTGVNLSESTLVNVYAEDANMQDANLSGAIVSNGDIHLAKYCNTTMPDLQIANGDCK